MRNNELHVHISTPHRQLDWVEAFDHPVVPSCDGSWLFLEAVTVSMQELLHSWCVTKPAMTW